VEERFKVTSLEKMVHLVAMLVESSRVDQQLVLSGGDMELLIGGKVSSSLPLFINMSTSRFPEKLHYTNLVYYGYSFHLV